MPAGYLSRLMATFDKLSADQRAIIELVLQRGKSYAELSDLLAMPESRVRELARDALVSLSPVSADRVEEDWRGQLADYVLGQQTGPESTAMRGHLRRSEPARTWARSLLDSLDTLYEGDLPTIPDGDRPARRERPPRRREREEEAAAAPAGEISPAARSAVRQRRRVGGALVALGVLALVVLVWPVGLLTSDDNSGSSSNAASTAPQPGSNKGVPAGIAIVASRNGKRQVIVQAASLPPNKPRQAYEVWLYNSPKDARSLGAQVTDQRGTFQGAGPLPDDYQRFQFIDVSREAIDQNRSHSGNSVLRGKIGTLKQAPASAKKGQAVILGQVVLTPPKG
jgi:anti-sigma-K factor RskA/sigma-70-like protein